MASSSSRVPTTQDVTIGTLVNIVLKVDQPSGRTVRGTVRDILTRGDHHRGIKVRLADGRIGRVRSLADGVSSDVIATQNKPDAFAPPAEINSTADGARWSRRARGFPNEQEVPVTQSVGLDAYIKPARSSKAKGSKGQRSTQADDDARDAESTSGRNETVRITTTVTCPVCNAFEGDEAAVEYHVASHFDS